LNIFENQHQMLYALIILLFLDFVTFRSPFNVIGVVLVPYIACRLCWGLLSILADVIFSN